KDLVVQRNALFQKLDGVGKFVPDQVAETIDENMQIVVGRQRMQRTPRFLRRVRFPRSQKQEAQLEPRQVIIGSKIDRVAHGQARAGIILITGQQRRLEDMKTGVI